MFKKPFSIATQSKVKGSDARKLRSNVAKNFTVTDDELETILPTKDLLAHKLDNKCVVYVHEGQPIFIDVAGRGDLVPTVYTLWKLPSMSRTIAIHAPVSPYLCRKGADIMLPGVLEESLCDFKERDFSAVLAAGNPMPFAVGEMALDRADITEMKGRAMKLIHAYGDELWASGDKSIPNPGFIDQEVTTFDGEAFVPEPEPADGDSDEEEVVAKKEKKSKKEKKEVDPDETEEERKKRKKKEKKEKQAKAERKEAAAAAAAGDGPEPAAAMGPAEVDDLLEYCFLAFAGSVDEAALPMAVSNFYSSMLKCNPSGTSVDVKKSSYKKTTKFVSAMSKRKLIKTQDRGGEPFVVAVDKSKREFVNFKPRKGSGGGDSSGKKAKGSSLPVITEMWRPDAALTPLFTDAGLTDKSQLFTAAEAVAVLSRYIDEHELEGEGGRVTLDDVASCALFKGFGRKAGDEMPTTSTRAEMRTNLAKRLVPYHIIEGLGDEPIRKKGTVPDICVTQDRTHGHNVTRVSGLETFGYDMEELKDKFKKLFMCTTSVAPMPGKNNKNQEVSIQGHQLDGVLEFLTTKYGIPRKYIKAKSR